MWLKGSIGTHQAPGDDVKGRDADLKQASGSLSPPARDVRVGARSAVSPRSLQPVPLEHVLGLGRGGAAQNSSRRLAALWGRVSRDLEVSSRLPPVVVF